MSKRYDKKQAARMVREQLARERRRQQQLWVTVIAAVLLLVAGVAAWVVYDMQQVDKYTAPAHSSTGDNGLTLGTGPTQVEIYMDYQCPGCHTFEAQASQTIDKALADNKITLILHPLGMLDKTSPNKYSSRSSASAGCASDGDKLWAYSKVVFDAQVPEGTAGPTDDQLIALGRGVGLDDTFAACVRDGRYLSWSKHVTQHFYDQDFKGTPTVLVSGKSIEPTLATFAKAIGVEPVTASAAPSAGASPAPGASTAPAAGSPAPGTSPAPGASSAAATSAPAASPSAG